MILPVVPPAVLKWAGIAAVGLVLLAGAYIKGRGDATENASERIGALTQALQDNEKVLEALRAENARWADLAQKWRGAADEAVKNNVREQARLAAANAKLKRELTEVYRNDHEAAAWADTPVPAAVADRLRR